jgi:single-stranded-DNA-specific exonuclease
MKRIPEHNNKIWRIRRPVPALSRIFARKLNISPVTAQLLINRGIYTVEHGQAFLGSKLEGMHPPQLLKDMEKAVRRILKAAVSGEKVLVYGDYDVDGITASVLMVRVLRRMGVNVDYYIPSRLEEGYGLHLEVLQKERKKGTRLLLTVDCGISSGVESLWAQENGLDVIITDHHEPPGAGIPSACAVINPKRPDCEYPFKGLAGVGVALKLAQALLEEMDASSTAWQEYLDLACLGTIADIVPVHGENRIIVKHGLSVLTNTCNCGLQALMTASGINRTGLIPREVSFGLAPRMNAAGRMGDPMLAASLLLAEDEETARQIAAELNRLNRDRQKIEAVVLEEALNLLKARLDLENDRVLVLASQNWHPGVIGIVASRLVEIYHRPVLLISLEGEKGKGSARSVPGFNIYDALTYCRGCLLEYGGHALAAGFSIAAGKVENFRDEINKYAVHVAGDREIIPFLEIDSIIDVAQVSEGLVNELNLLHPFGPENPDPLLCCLKTPVMESRGVGKELAHLKMRLRGGNAPLDGIGFNLGAYAEVVATAEEVDLAFIPGMNEYNGRRSLQLKVKDVGIPAVVDFIGPQEREDVDPSGLLATTSDFIEQEELFIPGFVLGVIKKLEVERKPEWRVPNLKTQNIELVDRRNSADRPGYMAELAGSGEPTLVITSCGYQTLELGYYMQISRPAWKGKVACCHSMVPEQNRNRLVKMFKAGEIKVLFATPDTAGIFGAHACQTVLYHLPFSPEEVDGIINELQPGAGLYFLFGLHDFNENIAGLESLAPDRSYLVAIYQLLHRVKNGSGQVNLNSARVARQLAKTGFPNSGEYTVRVALTVLEELDFIKSIRSGKSFSIDLYPAPTEKRNLMEAKTYRRLQIIKEESLVWMRKLLKEPLHNILWDQGASISGGNEFGFEE